MLAVFSLILLWLATGTAAADSPPNLTSDIPWTDTGGVYDPANGLFTASFSGVVDIAAAYDHARRQEEIQLGLATGALGNLSLPSQATWDAMGPDERMLYLINQERIARTALPTAAVLGLPMEGSDADLNALAQDYAELITASNSRGHYLPSGDRTIDSPSLRIDNDPVLGPCHEFLSVAENLAYFWTSGSSLPLPIERALYTWVYADAGSSWGHRIPVLIQDKDLVYQDPAYGYNNNVHGMDSEGFLGVGIDIDPNYNPYGFTWSNLGVVVVLNIIDPISTGSCPWDIDSDDAPASFGVSEHLWTDQLRLGAVYGANDGIAALPVYDHNGSVQLQVNVTNDGIQPAQLVAWIDLDLSGTFDNSTERSLPALVNPTGCFNTGHATDPTYTTGNIPATCSGTVTLQWNVAVPPTTQPTYARVRLTTESSFFSDSSPEPVGSFGPGETEAHPIASGTLPVTLGYFRAATAGDQVAFTWQTATETGTAGFNLLAMTDQGPVQLNSSLIQSKVIDSVEPTDYRFQAATAASVFYLEELAIDGRTERHGPFTLGQSQGFLHNRMDASLPPEEAWTFYLPFVVR